VPDPRQSPDPPPSWAFARTLVDELARQGLTDAVIAPGSRSAPLALALAEQDGVRAHVLIDERSAAFFALGLARASGRPAAVVCTSGTAAANFHPAVLEADHGRVPLLVLTADRPPELRGTGANQTTDQTRLYGPAVRLFADPGPPRPGQAAAWRGLAARAWAEATGMGAGGAAGPVHLNLPFDEPLVPPSLDGAGAAPGRPGGAPWTAPAASTRAAGAEEVAAVAALVGGVERGLVVAGWGAGADPGALDAFTAATGWPVLADPLSDLRRGPLAVSTYDALLRVAGFAAGHRPEVVLRLGAPPTSKALVGWLTPEITQVLVDQDRAWADPGRAAELRVTADPTALLHALAERLGPERKPMSRSGAGGAEGPGPGPTAWAGTWLAAEGAARRAIDVLLDGWQEPFEGRVARDLAAMLPDGATLVAGSSMPVRDLEQFARPRDGLRHLANRGLSGIDGFVATALGVAAARTGAGRSDTPAGPVAALCGDLTFLHDASGVLGARRQPPEHHVVFVVVDNDGGGIFSLLPQAGLPRHFETLFGTPHGLDLGALCDVAGLAWRRIAKAGELAPAVTEALVAGGTRVVLVPSERAVNAHRHREVAEAVAEAVG